ncbi:hypothetical protein ACFLSW_03665 [Candidatus Bipolaricaulota bacterium]
MKGRTAALDRRPRHHGFLWSTTVFALTSITCLANGGDISPPTLSPVTIESPTAIDPHYAKSDDAIVIMFTASEPLIATPVVTIMSQAAFSQSLGGNDWKAWYVGTETDAEGLVAFTIDFEDVAGNPGTQVTATTDGSFVVFDRTRPTAPLLTSPNDGGCRSLGSVTFNWEASIDNGSGVSHYEWGNDDSRDEHAGTGTSATYEIGESSFEWWIVAYDRAGNASLKDTPRDLEVHECPEEHRGGTDVWYYDPLAGDGTARSDLMPAPLGENFLPFLEASGAMRYGSRLFYYVFDVGDVVRGGCEITDGNGLPVNNAYVIAELYTYVYHDARSSLSEGIRETLTQLQHDVIHYNRKHRNYSFRYDTTDLMPGFYVIYLVYTDGAEQELCFILQREMEMREMQALQGSSSGSDVSMSSGKLATPFIPGGSVVSAALSGMGRLQKIDEE